MEVLELTQNKDKRIERLPIYSLRYDVYQRPVRRSVVNKIAKEFDPDVVGLVQVSERPDGYYYVFDGQHRVEGMKKLNMELVECLVFKNMTFEEEAKAFKYFNNTSKATRLEQAYAKLLAHDPEALKIDEITRKAGLYIDYQRDRHGGIVAVGALEDVYRKSGADMLYTVLNTLKRSFGAEDVRAYQRFLIIGFHKFIAQYKDNIDLNSLVRKLKRKGLDKYLKTYGKYSPAFHSEKSKAVQMSLVEIYNSGRKTENRIMHIYL